MFLSSRFVPMLIWTFILSVPAFAQERVVLKEARLVPTLVYAPDTASPPGPLSLPPESLFLSIRLEVPGGNSLPMDLRLLGVEASDPSNQRFKVIGLSEYDEQDSVVRVIWEPISSRDGKRISVTDFVISDDLNIEKKNVRLTLKKTPITFSLFFVVPAKVGPFQIHGLTAKPLTTGRLALP